MTDQHAAAAMGRDRYEFVTLPDGSGIQVSQNGKAIWLGWTAALDLGSALVDAYRCKVEHGD